MAFCSQCGTSLPDDARFCPKCGTAAPSDTGAARDTLSTAFGAAAQPGAAPQPQPIPAHAAPARGRGGPRWILPVMIVVALAVIGALLWSQRDGARPIAGDNASEVADKSEDGDKVGNGKSAERAVAPDETAEAEDRAGGEGDGGGEGATDAAAVESGTRTTAASLDSAFNADPQGARARYAGPVTVSGVIATMVNPGPTPSLSLEGRTRLNFIVANFPAGSRGELADLRKGDRVTLSCSGVNAIAGTTILQGCAME